MISDKRLQYEKTIDDIEEYIDIHGLKENDALPSERRLAEMLNVSRGTIRDSIEQMSREHKIYTIHGKGNFLYPKKECIDMHQMISFSGAVLKQQKIPSNIVLSFKRVFADATTLKKLDIETREEIYRFSRIRMINDKRISIEISHIPCKFCEGLDKYINDSISLYNILEEVYGIKMKHQDIEICLSQASKIEANYLGMEYLDPVFVENAIALDQEGRKIEYTKTITNSNNAQYTILLNS